MFLLSGKTYEQIYPVLLVSLGNLQRTVVEEMAWPWAMVYRLYCGILRAWAPHLPNSRKEKKAKCRKRKQIFFFAVAECCAVTDTNIDLRLRKERGGEWEKDRGFMSFLCVAISGKEMAFERGEISSRFGEIVNAQKSGFFPLRIQCVKNRSGVTWHFFAF